MRTRSASLAFLDESRFADMSVDDLEPHGIAAEIASRDGRPALHLVGAGESSYGERLALLAESDLADGTIEATLSGDTLPDAPPGARGSSASRSTRDGPAKPSRQWPHRDLDRRRDAYVTRMRVTPAR